MLAWILVGTIAVVAALIVPILVIRGCELYSALVLLLIAGHISLKWGALTTWALSAYMKLA